MRSHEFLLPNVGVDRARRLPSTLESTIKLRNTLPALRSNDSLFGGTLRAQSNLHLLPGSSSVVNDRGVKVIKVGYRRCVVS